jgi:predicted thioredoxin/glutaredoxin
VAKNLFLLRFLKIFTKIIRKNCGLRSRSHFFVPYSWATNIRVRNSENFYKDNKKKLRATKSIPFFRSIFVAKNLFLLRFLKIFTKIIRKNCGLRSRSHFFVPYSWATNIRVRNSENFYKDNKKKLRATKSIPFFRSIFVAKNLFLLRFLKIFTKIIRKNCGLRSRSKKFVSKKDKILTRIVLRATERDE